jgi:phage gpG-like protein
MNEEAIEGSAELERLLDSLMAALSPAAQRRLLMIVGRNLAAENRKRLVANVEPDGLPFTPRKIRQRVGIRDRRNIRGVFAALEAEGKTDSISRLAESLKKYHARHGRHRIREKLAGGRIRERLLAKKQRKMFRKLKSVQNLKAQLVPNGVEVGFMRSAGSIARIHHYGLNKKIPVRRLLGITAADEQKIEDIIMEQFAKLLS